MRLANNYDKYALYQQSVQNAALEIAWIRDKFYALRGRKLLKLREDFCGAAATSAEFVSCGKKHRAVAVDIDSSALQKAQTLNIDALPAAAQSRICLLLDDVLNCQAKDNDALIAMNFSYWIFKTRAELLRYFKHAKQQLVADGVLFLDAFGGYECFNEQQEVSHLPGYDYVWQLARFNPVDNFCHYKIHFRFADGSAIENAFEYHWRHWHLPEIKELLQEAGFVNIKFYFQDWDYAKHQPTDEFVEQTSFAADPGWVAYITAENRV